VPGPPHDEQSIRAELQRQGIDNFGELVSAAAREIRQRGDAEAQWSFFVGDWFVLVYVV
jgi:hypothetical protein